MICVYEGLIEQTLPGISNEPGYVCTSTVYYALVVGMYVIDLNISRGYLDTIFFFCFRMVRIISSFSYVVSLPSVARSDGRSR